LTNAASNAAPPAARDAAFGQGRSEDAIMDRQITRRTLRVTNSQGMHLRPCAAIAGLLAKYQCDVKVSRDDRTANGKSPLELMMLAAPQGTELTVEAAGPDGGAALDALRALWDALSQEEPETAAPG
jgi:phosphotransferase system HPr (HPr) family protein